VKSGDRGRLGWYFFAESLRRDGMAKQKTLTSKVFTIEDLERHTASLKQQAAETADPTERRALEAKVSAIEHSLRDTLGRGAANLEATRKGPAKSHKGDRKAKDLARHIAQTSWKEDPSERTGAMCQYVCDQLRAEGCEYVAATVRDWISDLAPPAARRPGPRKKK